MDTARKITAQVACEYITNHAGDGFDRVTIDAVAREAREAGVSPFYVDQLPAGDTTKLCESCEDRAAHYTKRVEGRPVAERIDLSLEVI